MDAFVGSNSGRFLGHSARCFIRFVDWVWAAI